MASTDARPIPIKNTACRVTFPILDNTGALVSGAAGLDSEVSKDGGTFADCTNEATEIATSSGMYYLDLTATEMNADTVAIIVKTTTTDAKTTPIVLYPQEADDIKVGVTHWDGTAVATPAVAGRPSVDAIAISGATGAADNVEANIANLDATISGISTALLGLTDGVESGVTVKQALRAILAFTSGKADGGNTTPQHYRDPGDTVNRITFTVDADGNRSAVTLNL